jgi:hypothetical protein
MRALVNLATLPLLSPSVTAPPPASIPAAVLAAPLRWALFLELEGCLAEPGAAGDLSVSPQTRYTLQRLFHALGGTVAVLTGRSLRDADCLLGLPDLPIVASHGRELRSLRKGATAPIPGSHDHARPGHARLLRVLLADPPFAGRLPLALGRWDSDRTVAATAASLGGLGLSVGSHDPAAAPGGRLATAAAARSLLHAWADMLAPVRPSNAAA